MVWRDLTRERLEETKQTYASEGYVMQWYAMAMEVILTILGKEWWKKNCAITAIKPDEFLSLHDHSEENRLIHQHRIITLGDMLYALKECKGYEAFISSLKKRDMSSTFFELWVANTLNQNNFTTEFIKAKGQKGEDYDLFAVKNDIAISVEAKSRRSGSILGEKALRNTLETARKQLPSLGPGIIFISIPTEWTMDENAEYMIRNNIDAFYRTSARVNYIVLVWHRWIELETGKAILSIVREYENPNPRTPVSLVQIVQPLEMPIKMGPEQQEFIPSFW